MPLLNYSTTISADKTASEVGRILAKAKVASTSTHYDDNGAPEGISFTLNTPHGPRMFRLPVKGSQATSYGTDSRPTPTGAQATISVPYSNCSAIPRSRRHRFTPRSTPTSCAKQRYRPSRTDPP